ncbi:hypothetical protein C8A05DRAFT_19410 [Staphylotrichum tortipilum]|uniref:Rhodopsin domain-containing protein n=1 Tax=Staphylotrichum tortipilum TaxID=2831512 RepID=A0AAN6MD21_9PEZI|nr:hypothetical protein C8A05DRAFT_19410 [Staphylotrichum longicolle]
MDAGAGADADADYGPQLNVLIWLLISVSGLFLFTRLYLKNCQNRGLWWDDWILLASWVALTASGSFVAYVISLGYGKRRIPTSNLRYFGLPVNILSTAMIISNLWGKTSFGVTLLRIPVRWMRVSVWFVLTTLTLILTTSVLLVWIECGTFKLPGRCVPVDVSIRYNVFSCAYSAAVDVIMALLPWKYLLSQQMSKKEKIGATVAMSMGLLAGATAAAKATTIKRVVGSDARGSIPLVALGTAESAACIMAASIPILRALSKGSFRRPAVLGYGTGYPTSMTTMVETGLGSQGSSQASLPPLQPPPRRPGGQRRKRPNSLEDMLTAVGTETSGHKSDDDLSDGDRGIIEMTNYRNRPQSPMDFTQPNIVPVQIPT